MSRYPAHDLIDVIDIGASTRDATTNVITINGKGVNLSDDPDNNTDDAEDFSDCATFGSLGVTSMPNAATDAGQCQGLIARNLNCFLGMRDTRAATVVGQLNPGDTCLHSTGPNQRARIFCKDDTNSVAILAADTDSNDMLFSLDGKNNVAMLQAFAALMQITKVGDSGEITIGNAKGFIHIDVAGVITLAGTQVILGSGAPTGGAAMGVPQAVSPGGTASLPFKCSGSVFITT